MREFLAIVGDTWRQSRKQVVFLIMCGLLALVAILMVALPKVVPDEKGEPGMALHFISDEANGLADGWIGLAVQARMIKSDDRVVTFDPEQQGETNRKMKELRAEVVAETADVSDLTKSVEMWSYISAMIVFTLSMLIFIGASSSYFPDLLETGAIDVVLAKPLTRLQVFLGKYVGGLVLFSAAIAATYSFIAVGLGLRTGVWSHGLLQVIPLQIFTAAVLFAIIALFGVLTRSKVLATIIGYVFYLVVDSAISGAIGVKRMGLAEDIEWLDSLLTVATYLPSFGFLKEVSINSCIYVQSFEARPVIVAAVWTVITLGLGYWRFRRSDF